MYTHEQWDAARNVLEALERRRTLLSKHEFAVLRALALEGDGEAAMRELEWTLGRRRNG